MSTPLILSVLIVASLVNAGYSTMMMIKQVKTLKPFSFSGHVNYNGHVYPMSIQIIGYMITGIEIMGLI